MVKTRQLDGRHSSGLIVRCEDELAFAVVRDYLENLAEEEFEDSRIELIYDQTGIFVAIDVNQTSENGDDFLDAFRFATEGNIDIPSAREQLDTLSGLPIIQRLFVELFELQRQPWNDSV